ncbi:MAG: hypothetical protein ABI539_07645 [Acidobacteriota bacterium]
MNFRFIFVILTGASLTAFACGGTGDGSANNSDRAAEVPKPLTDDSAAQAPTRSPISDARHENSEMPQPTPSLNPLPPDAPGVYAAIAVIHDYYAAINARNFRKAYELWSGKGEASHQTFEQFRGGFSDTAAVDVDTSGEPGDLEGAAGSQYVTIRVRITARTRSGIPQHFGGEYVLRRSMVDGATADQRAWRIYSASMQER